MLFQVQLKFVSQYGSQDIFYFISEQDSSELYVVSPKDIVLAQKRDEDDRVTWLLQTNQHREALEAVKQYGKRLKKHSYLVSHSVFSSRDGMIKGMLFVFRFYPSIPRKRQRL